MSAMMNHDDVGHNKKEDSSVSADNQLIHPFSNVRGDDKMYEMLIGLNYYSICEGPHFSSRLAVGIFLSVSNLLNSLSRWFSSRT